MRYMLLVYGRESETAESTGGERARLRAAHRALIDEATRGGVFEAAARLQPTATATTVRIEGGKPLVLDGAFAETTEQLTGYYILGCEDLDEAILWAAKIPAAGKAGAGCVEIRPIAALPPG